MAHRADHSVTKKGGVHLGGGDRLELGICRLWERVLI